MESGPSPSPNKIGYANVPPRGGKGGLILVLWTNIHSVPRETIHKGWKLMASTSIENLVDERYKVFFFRTGPIYITKISTDTDGALFIVNRDGIRYPGGIGNWVNELSLANLFNLNLNV